MHTICAAAPQQHTTSLTHPQPATSFLPDDPPPAGIISTGVSLLAAATFFSRPPLTITHFIHRA